jgi:hypothetical protein
VFDVVVKCVYCRLAFFTSVMAVFLMGQALRVMVDYWLSIWVDRKYQLSTRIYVISYACFVGAAITFSLGRALMFTKAALWSARKMHSLMAERVLRSPQLFFDQVRKKYTYHFSSSTFRYFHNVPKQCLVQKEQYC